MNHTVVVVNNKRIAVINSNTPLISNEQDALDLMMSIAFEDDCDRIALNKEALCEDFFDLRTGIAGEILQKGVNYAIKLAIVGDFSKYKSSALKDLMKESNRGKDAFFVSSEEEAIEYLSAV